jgi:hypothetical protein
MQKSVKIDISGPITFAIKLGTCFRGGDFISVRFLSINE